MRAIVVISLDMDDPDGLRQVLDHLDPYKIPHFGGQVRIAIDPFATQVLDWLEGDDEAGPATAGAPG